MHCIDSYSSHQSAHYLQTAYRTSFFEDEMKAFGVKELIFSLNMPTEMKFFGIASFAKWEILVSLMLRN